MKVLVVAATEFEIESFKNSVQAALQDLEFLITGPGLANTAFALGARLAGGPLPDLAINAGICGSFDDSLPAGTCVRITQDYLADFGAEDGELFLSATEIMENAAGTKIQFAENASPALVSNLPRVCSITVNTVSGNPQTIARRLARFQPQTESMEGAAFFMACNNHQLPCIQIRCVSNRVERRNKKNWNIPLAVQNLNRQLALLVTELSDAQ